MWFCFMLQLYTATVLFQELLICPQFIDSISHTWPKLNRLYIGYLSTYGLVLCVYVKLSSLQWYIR